MTTKYCTTIIPCSILNKGWCRITFKHDSWVSRVNCSTIISYITIKHYCWISFKYNIWKLIAKYSTTIFPCSVLNKGWPRVIFKCNLTHIVWMYSSSTLTSLVVAESYIRIASNCDNTVVETYKGSSIWILRNIAIKHYCGIFFNGNITIRKYYSSTILSCVTDESYWRMSWKYDISSLWRADRSSTWFIIASWCTRVCVMTKSNFSIVIKNNARH